MRKSRRAALFVRILVLVSCFTTSPAVAVPHLADFSLGLTYEEMLFRKVSPCGENLCGEVAFGGKNWGGTFLMKEGGLEVITLFGAPDDSYVEAAFEGLEGAPYVLYRVVTDSDCFDFVRRASMGIGADDLARDFGVFLEDLRGAGRGFASYFYTEPAVYDMLKAAAAEESAGDHRAEDSAVALCPSEISLAGLTPEQAAKVEEGVACCLTIDEGGVTFLVMPWGSLRRRLARGAAAPSAPEEPADASGTAEAGEGGAAV